MHVDAAYAGSTAILPEMRHWFDGLELASSFNTNAHKWLLTNFDCSALWVADAEPLKEALSMTPAYLRAQGNALDFKVSVLLPVTGTIAPRMPAGVSQCAGLQGKLYILL